MILKTLKSWNTLDFKDLKLLQFDNKQITL